ncbi:MAG: histidinol-phosphatase, partial [Psychromonas sp.]|nr:histidinol-phosphatase [Psychromonas sp.]
MIDLHSHILAGIDDGASTLEDSIALIEQSSAMGVEQILATPHIQFGVYDNNLNSIQTAFDSLCSKLQSTHLDISVAFAAELRICPEIMMLAKMKQLPFMGKFQEQDVLLLEFPHSAIPPGSEKLIDWLIKQNIRPMIAHPERNRDFAKFPQIMQQFKQRDCLWQLTAGSLLGDFGNLAETVVWKMVEEGDATVVASDMHNISKRPSKMKHAYDLVT